MHFPCSAHIAIIDNERTKKAMKKRLIEYEPSPGSQIMARCRLYSCALTLWCGLWLHSCMVGGLAYVL